MLGSLWPLRRALGIHRPTIGSNRPLRSGLRLLLNKSADAPAPGTAPRKKERNDLIDRLQYVGLRLVNMALHCFPVEANLGTAKLLGDIMYVVDRRHRRRALATLLRSFPEMTAQQRERWARRSMQQLFMLFVEILFTTRLIHLETWSKY